QVSGQISGSISFNGSQGQHLGQRQPGLDQLHCVGMGEAHEPAGNVGIAGTGFNGFPYEIAGLYADSTAKLHFFFGRNGAGAQDVSSAGSISTSAWTYVVATYDGSNVRLYITGALDSTTAASFTSSQAL